MRMRMLALAATGAAIAAVPLAAPALAGPSAAAKTTTWTQSGVLYNGKVNPKLTAHVNDWVKFVWKDGLHNVLTSAQPKGVKKVNTGEAVMTRKPLLVKLWKKGTYVFYCQPHRGLGMKLTVTVK